MAFLTEQIELSMCSPETGLPLTANVYTLEGVTEVDGTPRKMSIGQLVMAICLQRAAALEDEIITLMDAINQNTVLLDGLSEVEKKLVEVGVGGTFNPDDTVEYGDDVATCWEVLNDEAGITGLPTTAQWSYDQTQSVISLVEDKMDSLNTISQDTLIQLQSLTAKRDQTYDLASNAIKSFHTVLVGTANNM